MMAAAVSGIWKMNLKTKIGTMYLSCSGCHDLGPKGLETEPSVKGLQLICGAEEFVCSEFSQLPPAF